MNEFLEGFLKIWIGPAIIFLICLAWGIFKALREFHEKTWGPRKRIKERTNPELRDIIGDTDQRMVMKPAIEELIRRGEDYSEALPTLVAYSLSDSKVERFFGWVHLKKYFPQFAYGIEFNTNNPTDQSKSTIKKRLELTSRIDQRR